MNCLMIKLSDKRKFLTNKKNINHLVEFSKTFNAELSIVRTSHKNIKTLEQLADEICDTNKKQEDFAYEEVQKIIRKNNRKIFDYIMKTLRQKKSIDIEKIMVKFKKEGVDEKNIHSQINMAVKHLKSIGMNLEKTDKSQYKIKPTEKPQ